MDNEKKKSEWACFITMNQSVDRCLGFYSEVVPDDLS